MHGSPLRKWRDSDLWNKYELSDFGVVAEAFTSLDYNQIYYYTDTGRRWDGDIYNVRDKVNTGLKIKRARSTFQLIKILPHLENNIMLNSHPQRWNDAYISWFNELFFQNIKNIGKRFIKNRRKS